MEIKLKLNAGRVQQNNKNKKQMAGRASHKITHLHAKTLLLLFNASTRVFVRLAAVQGCDSYAPSINWCRRFYALWCTITTLPVSRSLSFLLVMSSRVHLFFPPRGYKSLATPRGRLNPHLFLQRRRFPVPRYAKLPDAWMLRRFICVHYILIMPDDGQFLHCTSYLMSSIRSPNEGFSCGVPLCAGILTTNGLWGSYLALQDRNKVSVF